MDNALVVYKTGVVHFDNYNEILSQAKELASLLEGVEVTPDTIKTSKKMIAEVRKKVDELDDARKDIKKEVLASYTEFETKVKAITSVVREAEDTVRAQVRELEEKERQAKYDEIVLLFKRRIRLYPELMDLFTHLDFVDNRHTNKTFTMKKVEEEIVLFLEHKKKSVSMIKDLQHADDILVEFVKTKDPIKAIENVKERNRVKESIRPSGNTVFTITATTEMEVKYIENILNTHGINFVK